jgi:hypothetical protein
MDSFAQHTASALGMSSIVLWVANSPKVFGYGLNKNITHNEFTKKPELKLSYLNQFNILGEPMEFPFNSEEEIFSIEDVLKSLED